MPPHSNTLQTIPPELRNLIYLSLAQSSTRVIIGRKFLASHTLGEHDGVIPVQFACAAALEPISMTCRQLNLESTALLTTALDPPAYLSVVKIFDLDQLDLFREFMDCPMTCTRDFQLRLQFDSRVLESALELERRVGPGPSHDKKREYGPTAVQCKIIRFMLFFALSSDRLGRGEIFAAEGDSRGDDGGGTGKATTESQGRETVQVLRRIRMSLSDRLPNARDELLTNICTRFETLLDVYVARIKAAAKKLEASRRLEAAAKRIEATQRLEAAAKRIEATQRLEAEAKRSEATRSLGAAAKRIEATRQFEAAARQSETAQRLEAAKQVEKAKLLEAAKRLQAVEAARRLEAAEIKRLEVGKWIEATAAASDGPSTADGTISSDGLTSGVLDSASNSGADARVEPPPRHSSWWD